MKSPTEAVIAVLFELVNHVKGQSDPKPESDVACSEPAENKCRPAVWLFPVQRGESWSGNCHRIDGQDRSERKSEEWPPFEDEIHDLRR